MTRRIHSITAIFASVSIASIALAQTLPYPQTKRVDHTDTYHGTSVADPYRWLEEDARKSTDVADWVEEQNKVTFTYLNSIPERSIIKERLTNLWNYEKLTAPYKAGGRFYYSRNSGLQNQFVVYTMDSLNSEPRVLFDPNTWSKDGTVALWAALPTATMAIMSRTESRKRVPTGASIAFAISTPARICPKR